MDFDELLTEAENAPVPSRIVRVCVNPTIAQTRAQLLEDLDAARKAEAAAAKADARLSQPVDTSRSQAALEAFEEHESQVQKALVTLKFGRLPGAEWALLTTAYPMRMDVALDRHYGYNYDAVSEKAAQKSGVRVDGDAETPLTAEQWERLFKVLSGHDVQQIRDTVWTLNEYEPAQHLEALVKDSGAA